MFVAVVVPLILGAIGEAWFGYRDQRLQLNELLQVEARSAADRIRTFIDGIRDQIGWVVQFPWIEDEEDRHKIDAERLLQQVAAIDAITLVDETGTERAFVSRLGLNRIGRGANMTKDPAVLGARASKVWYGPVRYRRDSEPYMAIAVAGNRAANGIAIANINLKLIWDVMAAIKIGDTGRAFVIDDSGRLIAHPDISLVLRGSVSSTVFNRIKSIVAAANGSAVVMTGDDGKAVVAASARVANVGWTVIAQQPISEAFASIRAALWRSLALIVTGTLFAAALAYWLAHRMSGPIRQLEDGAQRIGVGQFDHRITISSGDELEQLASRFNKMAEELAKLTARLQRASRMEAVGQFASGIAHNFNNIIAAILGYSELTGGELAPGSKAASHVGEIRGAAERGRHLVDSILTFGRRRDASRKLVSMRDLLREVASLLRASLPNDVELNIPDIPEQLAVWGEPAQLQQVILNLCSNAAQAMDGRGRIDAAVDGRELTSVKTLSHGELQPGSYIRLSVEDTGRGMDKAVERRLFEPFFTTRATGTGLGLATVREIVRDHEGAMNVTSLPMQGSLFEVWLPAAGVAHQSSLTDVASERLGRGETVLIIENDRELLLRDEELLAALGYEPIGFEHGEEALAALRADPRRFDAAVIGDASAASACALARSLSERLGGRPIILATTSTIDGDLDAIASAGVIELLRRPLVSAELAAALARCLRSPAPLPAQG